MRELFRGYYHPTNEEATSIWSQGTIVLDANVLLSLYKVTSNTATLYIEALRTRASKMWIPYQVAQEFHNNVHIERSKQADAHSERIKRIRAFVSELSNKANKSRLETLPVENTAIENLESLVGALEKQKKSISSDIHHHKIDDLLAEIASLFEGRVGVEPTAEELKDLYDEGQKRYDEGIPPGFEDVAKKDGPRKYGDFILWSQILDHATQNNIDIIFVTDDDKSDWWLKREKTSLAPLPALIQEFRSKTGQEILIYNSTQFYRELLDVRSSGNTKDQQAIDAAFEDMQGVVERQRNLDDRDVELETTTAWRARSNDRSFLSANVDGWGTPTWAEPWVQDEVSTRQGNNESDKESGTADWGTSWDVRHANPANSERDIVANLRELVLEREKDRQRWLSFANERDRLLSYFHEDDPMSDTEAVRSLRFKMSQLEAEIKEKSGAINVLSKIANEKGIPTERQWRA